LVRCSETSPVITSDKEQHMTMILIFNLVLAFGVVTALAVVCRIPYRLVSDEWVHERMPAADPSPAPERERRAA
jgi:hypothetical protein